MDHSITILSEKEKAILDFSWQEFYASSNMPLYSW